MNDHVMLIVYWLLAGVMVAVGFYLIVQLLGWSCYAALGAYDRIANKWRSRKNAKVT